MDAKDFVRACNRICKSRPTCIMTDDNGKDELCPIGLFCNHATCGSSIGDEDAAFVDIVEKWAKEHPVKTNRDILEEKFGPLTFTYAGLGQTEDINDIPLSKKINVNGMPISNWLNAEYKEPEEEK